MVKTYKITEPHTIEIKSPTDHEHFFFADGEILPMSENGVYTISILPNALSIVKRI